MSPPRGSPCAAGAKGKEITSVGPRCPRCRRLSAAIAREDTKATETRACGTRSARSTRWTRRSTRARPSGARTPSPCTSTSRLIRRELGRHAAARGWVVGAVVMLPDEGARELLLDDLDLTQREGRVPELPRIDPLPHDVVDDGAQLLRRRVGHDARRGLDAVGEHDDRRLCALGIRARIGELRRIDLRAISLLRLL